MAGKNKLLVGLGLTLLALGLGLWLARSQWESRARSDAQEFVQEAEATYKSALDLIFKPEYKTGNGDRFTLIQTEPPGALVYHQGQKVGDRTTPVIVPGENFEGLEFHSPWHLGETSVYRETVKLEPLLIGRLSAPLVVLGALLLGLGLRSGSSPAQPQRQVNPANRFGQYERLELLGEGAMGSVYEARSLDTGDSRRYALKVLQTQLSEDETFRARFEREAAICAKLDHPGIVHVHAKGEKEGQLWLAMDLIEGQDLGDWLQKKPSEARIVELTLKLCQALSHAHGLEIIHRDLKPENIMVTAQEEPIIMDFGLARGEHYATITQANTTLGTPQYMAPEQVRGDSRDPRSDLYSLGCILYQCLAGHAPFEGHPIEVIMAQVNSAPAPLEGEAKVSPELAAIVHCLLAKKVVDRYASVEELVSALKSLNA